MILPVVSLGRNEHQSSRPTGLILDTVYEARALSTNSTDAGFGNKAHVPHLLDVQELEGQLCEISISHDGDFATAVAIVPSMKVGKNS
jgi:holo-[acyl-carrier protein] synthase